MYKNESNSHFYILFQDTNNQAGVGEMQLKIAEEEDVRRRWRVENVRRRHNYLPFIVELLKSLASKEQLVPVIFSLKILTFLKFNTKEDRKPNV